MAPSQLQAAPTPRICGGDKEAARKSAKKIANSENKTVFLCPHNSPGHNVRSSRPSAGKFPTSPHALDDVENRSPLRTPVCNLSGNHVQDEKTTVMYGCRQSFAC